MQDRPQQSKIHAGLSSLLFTLLSLTAVTGGAQELPKPRLDLGLPASIPGEPSARVPALPAKPATSAFDDPIPADVQVSPICRDGSRSTSYHIEGNKTFHKCDEIRPELRERPSWSK